MSRVCKRCGDPLPPRNCPGQPPRYCSKECKRLEERDRHRRYREERARPTVINPSNLSRDVICERVLASLRRIGRGVRADALARMTRLPESEVEQALAELEAQGLVVPWSWAPVERREAA